MGSKGARIFSYGWNSFVWFKAKLVVQFEHFLIDVDSQSPMNKKYSPLPLNDKNDL